LRLFEHHITADLYHEFCSLKHYLPTLSTPFIGAFLSTTPLIETSSAEACQTYISIISVS
jgi:hypothetical protein